MGLFVSEWRQLEPPENSPADLNADGALDYLDLEAFVDLMLAANTPDDIEQESDPVARIDG